MSEKVIGNQYIYNGPGYLDSKIQPVDTVADLNGILLRQRFEGLTVTVLHPDGPDSSPADYWLVQDPAEEEGVLMWVRKTASGGKEYSAGDGIEINSSDEIGVKLAEVDEKNQNYLSVDDNGLTMNMFIEIDE